MYTEDLMKGLLKDPYYARIIFGIERHIRDYDLKVQENEEVVLKDSDINSALQKAINMLKGAAPPRPPKTQKDRLKGALAIEFVGIFELAKKEIGVSRSEFMHVLLAIVDSLKLRREMAGHSRGYLEFLSEFIPELDEDIPD